MSGGTLKKNVWRVQILLSSLKENSEPPIKKPAILNGEIHVRLGVQIKKYFFYLM